MNSTDHIDSSSDIISRIKVHYDSGHLNEAYELIELIEGNSLPMTGVDEMKLTMLKGIVLIKRGEYKAAEDNILRSLELASEYGDIRQRYNRCDNLVAIYTTTKQVHQAIEYIKKSIELKESVGNEIDMARSQLQLASLMFSVEDFDSGQQTLQKADSLISRLDNIEIKIQYIFSYTVLLMSQRKYEEALSQYDQMIAYALKVNDPYVESRAYINQGGLMMLLERWDDAENKYKNALEIAEDNHLSFDELFIYLQLSKIALKQKKLMRCRELYEYVTNHKDLTEDDTIQEDMAELGAQLFDAEGKKEDSLRHYQRYMEYYKKHYDNEQTRTVLYIKARYEIEKKERELQSTKLRQIESELKAMKAEKALIRSEKRFKAWVENGTDMIVILDENFHPTYASPYVYKALELNYDELREAEIYDLIPHADIGQVREQLKISKENPGVAVQTQFRLPQKDARYKWIEATITNLLTDETVDGIVCNLKDITERKQSEEAIQELNKSLELKITERTHELQEAIKDLEAFSYSVSHDLRSPLRIITGYGKLLQTDHGPDLNEEAKEFVETILDNAKRMGQLINDLLNFSRMGRKAVYKSTVDMNLMASGIIAEFRRSDHNIATEIVTHDLDPAYCDSALIKQVWINLISNAIKYSSKKNRPLIEIGCTAKLNETIYYIKDNGAGFDMRFAKNLFGVFKRLHDRSEFDGMGVGLALASRIIKMHEGRIWAEAEVGKGATFFFTLGQNNEHTS